MTRSGTALTADGAELEWTATGSGEPVLLIAGQAVTRHSWDPIVPFLAERFEVVTFDQRGIGASTDGSHPPRTTRAIASDLQYVLSSAGVERAHVIGHSMGGRIAQWAAIDDPDAVGALVLIATTGGDSRGALRSAEATAALRRGEAEDLAGRFFTDSHLRTNPSAVDVFVRKEGSLGTRRRAFEASSEHDAWDDLVAIRSPTLVVHGAQDSITPVENGRALAAAISGAEYLEVVDGRHAPQLDHAAVVDAIIDFLTRHPLGRGSDSLPRP